MKGLFKQMYCDDEYKSTLNSALESAAISLPILTEVAVAVDTHLGGSLGTRSTRKQLQALFHYTAGNLVMIVNSSSKIPSTCVFPICAFIGEGKSKSQGFIKHLIKLLADGTAILDREIQAKKVRNQPDDVSNIVPLESHAEDKKGFKPRKHIHGPGTKEAWESALHKENRVIQLVEEGDLW